MSNFTKQRMANSAKQFMKFYQFFNVKFPFYLLVIFLWHAVVISSFWKSWICKTFCKISKNMVKFAMCFIKSTNLVVISAVRYICKIFFSSNGTFNYNRRGFLTAHAVNSTIKVLLSCVWQILLSFFFSVEKKLFCSSCCLIPSTLSFIFCLLQKIK